MADFAAKSISFAGYTLDCDRASLWFEGELVKLPPKAIDLLILLVTRSPDVVSRQEILDNIWSESFVEDGNINYTISLLRKSLKADNAIQTVPRRGYRFNAELLKTKDLLAVEQVETKEQKRGAYLKPFAVFATLIFVTVLTTALSAYMSAGSSDHLAVGKNLQTIAVLPFESETPADTSTKELAEESYMLTAAVIERLSKISGIMVRPLESVEKMSAKDIASAGEKLRSDIVVTGKIFRGSSGVSVELNIYQTKNGKKLRQEKIDISTTDHQAFHSDVTFRIASALMKDLSVSQKETLRSKYTDHPEAYLNYIKGMALFRRSSGNVHDQILEHFNKATAIDPTFALAYAGIANLYFRAGSSAEGAATQELTQRAEAFAYKALELDPALAEAHIAISRSHRALRKDWAAAEASLRKAIDLDPVNVQALGFLGQLLILRGDHRSALQLTDRIAEIDPTAHPIIFLRFRGYEAARDNENGLKAAENAFLQDKHIHYARISYATFLFNTGNYEKMSEIANEGFEKSKGFSFVWHQLLARAALKNNDTSKAQFHIDELLKGSERSTKHLYRLAVIYAEQGEADKAFAALEKCLENNEAWMVWMNSEPGFDNIRNDQRFTDLLVRMKLKQ